MVNSPPEYLLVFHGKTARAETNPPIEAQQTDFHSLIPSLHWTDYALICLHCGEGEETAEHLLLLCPKWTVERYVRCVPG